MKTLIDGLIILTGAALLTGSIMLLALLLAATGGPLS